MEAAFSPTATEGLDHRLVIVGAVRKGGPPQLSPVYYLLDGTDLLISTTKTRAKAKVVHRDPSVSLCVLNEGRPYPYLTVYGRGRVEEDDKAAVDVMARATAVMTGNPMPDSMRPQIEERAKREGRVVLRVTPESFFP